MLIKKGNMLPIKTPFYFGWIIVFVSAMGLFLSGPGQTYSVSIFIDYFIEDLGWSRSTVSFLYSLGTLFAGLTVFFIGKQFDIRGHRKIMALVAIFFGLALFWMSFVGNLIMLVLGFYFIRLLGQSLMTVGPATLVPKWFEEKRGRALSLMSIGGPIGAAVIPPLNIWLITTWNWRLAWQFWAIVIWVVMIPLALIFVRDKPQNVNLNLDGISDSEKRKLKKTEEQNCKKAINISAASETLAEAKRQPVFWFLLYCMFVPSMVGTAVTFHIISIFGERGLSPEIAALTLSLMAVAGFLSTLMAGFILERIKVRYVMIITYSLYSLSMLFLIFIQNVQMALIFAVFQGLIMGFHQVNINMIWPTYFGLDHLGSIRGAVQIAFVIGAACGPFPLGIAFDYFGGYNEILFIMLIFPLLGILASYLSVAPGEKVDQYAILDDKKLSR